MIRAKVCLELSFSRDDNEKANKPREGFFFTGWSCLPQRVPEAKPRFMCAQKPSLLEIPA